MVNGGSTDKPDLNSLAAGAEASGSAAGGGGNSGGVVFEQLDRKVSYYKLTSSDITLLGFLGFLSSLFLTVGGGAFGFYLNFQMSLAFAPSPIPPAAEVLKVTVAPIVFWVGLAFLALGLFLGIASVIRFYFIRKDHVKRTGSTTI